MTVEEVPIRHQGEQKIARFLFTPGADALSFLEKRQKYVLEIDAATGVAKGIKTVGGSAFELNSLTSMIDVFGTEKYLDTRLDGFPVDWITHASELGIVPAEKEERIELTANKQARFVKTLEPTTVAADLTGNDAKQRAAVRIAFSTEFVGVGNFSRVAQVWVPGEPWWRSFQRWSQDNLDLEAVRVEDE